MLDPGNPFSDLVPDQTYHGPINYSGATVTAAPPGFIPTSERGPRPQLADFRDANGHIDGQAYHNAMIAWSGTSTGLAQLPPPAASGGASRGTGGAPAPAPLPPTTGGGTGGATGGTTGGATNALSPAQALNNFANSAGMQFQLQQGANTIQQYLAARGALQSGAAMKSLQSLGQQTALNNYFMPYMNLLGDQQSVGVQAGSSVAGVGSSFGSTAGNIVNGMGGAVQSGANSNSNSALLNGANNANMWNSIGGALGGLGSSFFPSGA